MPEEPKWENPPLQSYQLSFLYTDQPKFDGAVLVERLNPEIRTELISSSDEIIGIAHPEYRVQLKDGNLPTFTQFARFMKRFDRSEFAAAVAQTWDWEEAEGILKRCKHRVLMGDVIGGGLPYKDRHRIISAVAIAWSELTRPAAIHWEPAGCMIEPAKLKTRLGQHCNVRLFNVQGHADRSVMDTLGLAAFGLPDLQLDFVGLEPGRVAGFLYAYGDYVFEKGDVIEDGNTVDGPSPGERWRCRHGLSLIEPKRVVVDVHAGEHASFSFEARD